MAEPRVDIGLLCPFDLGRSSGTPFRAVATLEAIAPEFEVEVLATSAACGARVLRGAISRRTHQLSIPGFTFAAARALRRMRPRVVHCVTPVGLLPALIARVLDRDLRVVVEFHAPAEFEMVGASGRARALFRAIDRHLVRRADAVIVVSNSQRDYLLECGVAPEAIQVSWGPIDVERERDAAADFAPPITFGYFGNANFWQGVDTLVAALRSLDGDPARVLLGGLDESDLPAPPPEGVTVLGVLPRDGMLAAMGSCDVLISPRRGGEVTHYQYPFKLSAYLAAGRPVIGTDVNDQGLIINGAGCGLVVPPDDPAALAGAIRQLSAAPPAELKAMGDRARAFAEEHLDYDALRAVLRHAYALEAIER